MVIKQRFASLTVGFHFLQDLKGTEGVEKNNSNT